MRFIYLLVFVGLIAAIVAAMRLGWIPETAAITLFAGLIPLVGVLLSLEWSQRQFRTNLNEEREKTAESRKFTAKQTAFIRAAEAVIKAIAYLSTLADRKLPTQGETDKELQDLGPALIQLHFYCDYRTIEKSLFFGRSFAESLGEVLRAKITAGQFDWQITANEQQIAETRTRIDRYNEEMLTLLRADINHPLLNPLREAIRQNHERLAALHGTQAGLIGRKSLDTEHCRAVAISKMPSLQLVTKDLLLCARRELKFPIEEAEYAKLMEAQTEAAQVFLQKLVKDIQKDIAAT